MKISIIVTENAMQFNLEPENDHESKFLEILTTYNGEVTITKGVELNMCQAGFVRSFGPDPRMATVTIVKKLTGNPSR
jgi:hypothetical protein